MKFYEEFYSNKDSIKNILEYDKISDNYMINEKIINNNRALVGDYVEIAKCDSHQKSCGYQQHPEKAKEVISST